MKFLRIGAVGAERPAVLDEDGHYWDLTELTNDIDGPFLAGNGPDRARDARAAGQLQRLETIERIGPPIQPEAIICIGQNYAAHAAESGAGRPASPVVFLKTPNTVIGPYDDVLIPPGATRVDWEVELGVVIGRRAAYLGSPQDSKAHVGGYVVSNDVSERAYQLDESGGQWSKGKCCPTFNPLGPWLVTPDEVPQPQELRLRSWVNNEPRQASTTADMIFTVDYLIWHLSHYLTLEPGYLISTGTPEGVALSGRFPYLSAGDEMAMEVDGLGRQHQHLVPTPSAPTSRNRQARPA